MQSKRLTFIAVIACGLLLAYFVIGSQRPLFGSTTLVERFPFSLGLDLAGGSELTYEADVSQIPPEEVKSSMESLRDIIERRVNIFGVSETSVRTEQSFTGQQRLSIALPGVTDTAQAARLIGETPVLDFRVQNPTLDMTTVDENTPIDMLFVPTLLTGKYLERASMQFTQPAAGQMAGEPYVSLVFNKEGADLFEQLTSEHIGKMIAIYLDGAPISTPVVQQVIKGGEATITGSFSPEEAKELAGRLTSGALPVPIELVGTTSVSAPLGEQAVADGVAASILGLALLASLFVLWYRASGIVAVIALVYYTLTLLALFKVIPVTLTASGIAGFIISLGVAVDANVLIAERIKEELAKGGELQDSIQKGFGRAWTAIRDANFAGLLTSAILYWFGTSLIKGFALTLGLGILASLFSATVVSKSWMVLLAGTKDTPRKRFFFSSGFSK